MSVSTSVMMNGRCAPARAVPRAASRLRVMQLTDWLEPGGKERVALNLGNLLPRDRYESFLCTTRSDGALARLVATDVDRLRLDRQHAFEWRPILRLAAFNVRHRIDVMHAHGSSLFVASLASMFAPFPAVVWHDHYGPYRSNDRPVWLYRLAARRVKGVIAVNRPLADWARDRLGVDQDRVWYIPNFICERRASADDAPADLPGRPGARIVCVAHQRPQKDHATLLRAFAAARAVVPDAHLILVGGAHDRSHSAMLRDLTSKLRLQGAVSDLGSRDDVDAILRASDVGVLSSVSEGFPLALVEYGAAGLAAVATDVGQCSEVLDSGRAGLVVEPSDPGALGRALIRLLREPGRREVLGSALRERVHTLYRSDVVMKQICRVYDVVTGGR